MMNVSEKDIQTLRALATRYMEYAISDKNKENKRLWIALNTHQMQKPLCTIDQIPWHEMDVTGTLCPCSYTFDGVDAWDLEHPTTYDGWTYGMAQLFTSVSPDITEEFEVPYM